MDEIFHETTNAFNVVKIAHDKPHRFGKKGELLIDYTDTEAHRRASSVAAVAEPKIGAATVENAASEKPSF